VRDRDAADLVAEAKLAVSRDAQTAGWGLRRVEGQFEHAIRARQTLMIVVPIVVALIFLVLLCDLSRPGRRGADDAGRAGRDRRRALFFSGCLASNSR